jgi:hypothetical protein
MWRKTLQISPHEVLGSRKEEKKRHQSIVVVSPGPFKTEKSFLDGILLLQYLTSMVNKRLCSRLSWEWGWGKRAHWAARVQNHWSWAVEHGLQIPRPPQKRRLKKTPTFPAFNFPLQILHLRHSCSLKWHELSPSHHWIHFRLQFAQTQKKEGPQPNNQKAEKPQMIAPDDGITYTK